MPRSILILTAGAWLLLFSTLSCMAIILHNAAFAFVFGSALGAGTATIFGLHRYLMLIKEFKTLESRIIAMESRVQSIDTKTHVFINDGYDGRPTIH